MKMMKVKPKKGMKVPYPMESRMIPEGGADVPMTGYWMRRLNDGDIIEQKELSEKSKASNQKNKQKPKLSEVEA